ncbi:MAG: hypothetical protein RLZ10_983 [Bacteroidota bacterium]|jgi:hypothetical protein
MSKIFIQIASFSDPELIPTIKDCINNAKHPENLVFSICRQYHPDYTFDDLSEYEKDKRFKVINVLYSETLGACWARHQLQKQYSGEEYTLQIDSHMRFVKDWDEISINMIKDLQLKGYKKPLLTGYVSSYDPDNDPNGRINVPWRMVFDRFIPEGAVFFLPESIPNHTELKEPIPSRFYSAHFCFTIGSFVKEVPHDENYYFHGEEISIAARAYTHGYDLFHPHIIICWHEYTRKNRKKVWDYDNDWYIKNDNSHLRNRKLFSMDGEVYNSEEFGIYGFGNERTLRDYEKYSGILFSKRSVQQYTIDKNYPPNPTIDNEEEWLKSFTSVFKHCIDINRNQLSEDDYDFWAVTFNNQNGKEIYRKDADKNEINRLMSDKDGYYKIWREFNTSVKPSYWVVWAHSISKGWCERITGNL